MTYMAREVALGHGIRELSVDELLLVDGGSVSHVAGGVSAVSAAVAGGAEMVAEFTTISGAEPVAAVAWGVAGVAGAIAYFTS